MDDVIEALLSHMIQQKRVIPTPEVLLKTYEKVLKDEAKHWRYQEKCWREGSYHFRGGGEEHQANAVQVCLDNAKEIEELLKEFSRDLQQTR